MTPSYIENIETFQAIVEASPCALILTNKRGEIIFFNQFAENLFQYNRQEITGQSIEILIPEPVAVNHHHKRHQYMQNPETRHMGMGRDLLAQRKDKTQFQAEIGLKHLIINKEPHVLATVLNISIRKKYEAEIKIRNKQLAELSFKLSKANEKLETKNKNMLDSIEYAKKIQRSILPDHTELEDCFDDFALYYAPKDIIGGDIYWYKQYNKTKYLAAVDCTGHSVPGAMLSIVVFSLLNEVCEEMPNADTGLILESLHSKLYAFLQQKKGEDYSQDGCDISLCKIDEENRCIQYSGAWQNLYLYNGTELKIIKATSKHIGGYSLLGLPEPQRSFKTENIDLPEKTLIAMSTDGVIDQLDQNDKVFGYKKFEELIISQYNNSGSEMSLNIANKIDEWKENSEQLDDMLIVSFKL